MVANLGYIAASMKIIIVLLSFTLCSALSAQKSPKSKTFSVSEISAVIGRPIIYFDIEIAQNGFQNEMTFMEAKEACRKLGDGWRLPNWDEMGTILHYSQEKKLFMSSHVIWGTDYLVDEKKTVAACFEINADFYDPDGPGWTIQDEEQLKVIKQFVIPVRSMTKGKK